MEWTYGFVVTIQLATINIRATLKIRFLIVREDSDKWERKTPLDVDPRNLRIMHAPASMEITLRITFSTL